MSFLHSSIQMRKTPMRSQMQHDQGEQWLGDPKSISLSFVFFAFCLAFMMSAITWSRAIMYNIKKVKFRDVNIYSFIYHPKEKTAISYEKFDKLGGVTRFLNGASQNPPLPFLIKNLKKKTRNGPLGKRDNFLNKNSINNGTGWQTDRRADRKKVRQTAKQPTKKGRQADWHTDRQTDRTTDRHMNRENERQAKWQTDKDRQALPVQVILWPHGWKVTVAVFSEHIMQSSPAASARFTASWVFFWMGPALLDGYTEYQQIERWN